MGRKKLPAGSVGASNAAAGAEIGVVTPQPPRPSRPARNKPHSIEENTGRWTDKQRVFAAAYLRHKTASRAVKEAGYDVTPENAGSLGSQVLSKPHVRAYVDARIAELCDRYLVDADRVIGELATISFLNLGDFIKPDADGQAVLDLRDLTDRQWKAIGSIEIEEKTTVDQATGDNVVTKTTKLKPLDKLKATEALGRHLKLFTDKLELSGSVDVAGRIKAARDRMRAERDGHGTDELE